MRSRRRRRFSTSSFLSSRKRLSSLLFFLQRVGLPFSPNLRREMDACVSHPSPAIEKISSGRAATARLDPKTGSKAAATAIDGKTRFVNQESLPPFHSLLLPEQAEPVARVAAELSKGRAVAHFVVSLARSALLCSALLCSGGESLLERSKKKSERGRTEEKKNSRAIFRNRSTSLPFFSFDTAFEGSPE